MCACIYINNFSTSQARCYTAEGESSHYVCWWLQHLLCLYIRIYSHPTKLCRLHVFISHQPNRIESVFFVAHNLSALFHSFILLSFPLSFICSVLQMFHAIMCNIYANVYLYALHDYPLSILKNDGLYYANDRRVQFLLAFQSVFFCFHCFFTKYIPSTSK